MNGQDRDDRRKINPHLRSKPPEQFSEGTEKRLRKTLDHPVNPPEAGTERRGEPAHESTDNDQGHDDLTEQVDSTRE